VDGCRADLLLDRAEQHGIEPWPLVAALSAADAGVAKDPVQVDQRPAEPVRRMPAGASSTW
jgi:hypothetical protein